MKKLDEHRIKELGRRSGLRLKDKEVTGLQQELEELSFYLDKLKEIETGEPADDLQQNCWIHKNKTTLRRDVVEEFGEKELLMENMPGRNQNYLSAPKVIK